MSTRCILILVALAALLSPCLPAAGDSAPDLVYTLGVGARGVGMGGAFTAIADDASASFWNPARLGEIPNVTSMAEIRSVARSVGTGTDTTPHTTDVSVRPVRLGFAGVTRSLGDFRPGIGPSSGTLGLSWALGGYLDLTEHITEGSTTTHSEFGIKNMYQTVAWGKNSLLVMPNTASSDVTKFPVNKVGFGLAYFWLDQRLSQHISITENGETSDVQPEVASSAFGSGYMVGVTMEDWGTATRNADKKTWDMQPLPTGGRTRLALVYRSGGSLNGGSLATASFGDHVPSRLAAGIAYDWTEPSEKVMGVRAPRQFTAAAELQRLSRANGPADLDERKAVINLHAGMEYIPGKPWLPIPGLRKVTEDGSRPAYVMPIRLGFRTNRAANTDLFQDDFVLTGGLALYYGRYAGAARGNYDFSVESAGEYFLEANKFMFVVSGNYRF